MPLGMEVGLDASHIVLDGDLAPPEKRHRNPLFSAHVYCQMARWTKIALGMQVGLSPGEFVLDGDPAPHPPKRGKDPQFSAHVYRG